MGAPCLCVASGAGVRVWVSRVGCSVVRWFPAAVEVNWRGWLWVLPFSSVVGDSWRCVALLRGRLNPSHARNDGTETLHVCECTAQLFWAHALTRLYGNMRLCLWVCFS
ncbi:hypothetical protein TraAM80_09839 [Trypanosoma rangeli]|uniref:Uncharacterized protein n=1 Tax=Trypanosoma rangeli TaxID=5698 RepID=A0A3R7M046_TRYRA|nr:uncharacterized protein TraAM80_09839 [Trypanosoma rangeli]RNE96910.1 hypothetical protein TraAM80_09839 [Trypanosoma rangeli]|eukprot:RNE96910.1 hypothetical protein TraAM80_09839 [Trypanosoma rangeli]